MGYVYFPPSSFRFLPASSLEQVRKTFHFMFYCVLYCVLWVVLITTVLWSAYCSYYFYIVFVLITSAISATLVSIANATIQVVQWPPLSVKRSVGEERTGPPRSYIETRNEVADIKLYNISKAASEIRLGLAAIDLILWPATLYKSYLIFQIIIVLIAIKLLINYS